MTGLAAYLEGWSPEPVRRTDRISRWPVDAFAGLLDQPSPLAGDHAVLPPMWHCFSFLDHPAQRELGVDGHPADGPFLPPIPHRRRMFAGGRWRRHRPLRVDDEVALRAAVASTDVKAGRGGELAFVTVRRELSVAGELAVVEEQDIVYRSQPDTTPEPSDPAGTGAGVPAADGAMDGAAVHEPPTEHELTLDPDPALLFRVSALTHNAHRIHYDQPYATAVEGYPGLVVHGPLLALLALELPRRHHRNAEVVEFRYRLRRPAFAGTPVLARSWSPKADGWCELAVGVPGRPASLTASARLRAVGQES